MPVFPRWQLVHSQVPWKRFSEGYRRKLSNTTFVYLSITRFWFCSQCMWQVFIHSGYYEVSCPTPCSGTRKKWMHSLKIGGEEKTCPVLWAYLKWKEGGRYKKADPVNALCASISPSNQDAKRKLSADERVVVALPPAALWTMVVSSAWHKSSTWTKGNLGTWISIQILLTVTPVSHSMSSPVPGNRPVPAAGIGV